MGRGNGSRLDADLLTGAEVELLMRRCSRRAPTGVRNRALIAVLWRCGLRLGEALALAAEGLRPRGGHAGGAAGQGRQAAGGRRRRRHRRARRPLARAAPKARHRRRAAVLHARGRADGPVVRAAPAAQARQEGRASSAGCTRTGSGTRSRSTSSAAGRRSTSSATRSATRRVATTQVYLSRVGAHEAVDAMRNREWAVSGVRVWLDDTREAPPGWVRTFTPEQVIALLRSGGVTELSLDHDLGLEPGRTGLRGAGLARERGRGRPVDRPAAGDHGAQRQPRGPPADAAPPRHDPTAPPERARLGGDVTRNAEGDTCHEHAFDCIAFECRTTVGRTQAGLKRPTCLRTTRRTAASLS